MFGLGYHDISDKVDQPEELFSRSPVVAQVDLTGVDCLVSDYADNIESLLNAHIQAFFDQSSNICINVLALFPELLAKLL